MAKAQETPDEGPPPTLETDSGAYVAPTGGLKLAGHTLRLDVDGRYPQMTASGTRLSALGSRTDWIADVQVGIGAHHWTGSIWYRAGDTTAFSYTTVDIQVTRGSYSPLSAIATFSGGGGADKTEFFKFNSTYFRTMEFEFDAAEGTKRVTSMVTSTHPNRPATLPDELLHLTSVYRRAGFDVKKSGGDDIVPLDMAEVDEKWSDTELHDAMQVYWSRFEPKAQWSVWVFFASLFMVDPGDPFDYPGRIGGTMFDEIGPNHRQGAAIFEDSFISEAPPDDPKPDAWVSRMRFWTAAHEMGHTFNLAHSWQKTLQVGNPWTFSLTDEPAALSFMNYPYYYPLGYPSSEAQSDEFFENFEYRFSDAELLFMRHAPFRFVQQGNAPFFDDHGFEGAKIRMGLPYRLQVRVNRARPVFEFMEPAVIELKLTNVSAEPGLIPDSVLARSEGMTVIVKKDGGHARQWLPYARHCMRERRRILNGGESIYGSLFVGAGRSGWNLSEPGNYTLQVALHVDGEDIVSNAMRVRVTPPRGYDEAVLAQDFFSDDVGRILTFGGSLVLTRGNEVLKEVIERLPHSRAAVHAGIALGNAVAVERKRLELGEDARGPARPAHMAGGRIVTVRPKEGEARRLLTTALAGENAVAAETLGHIAYKRRIVVFAEWLVQHRNVKEAARVLNDGYDALSRRGVHQRLLEDLQARSDEYKNARPASGGPRQPPAGRARGRTRRRTPR